MTFGYLAKFKTTAAEPVNAELTDEDADETPEESGPSVTGLSPSGADYL